MKSNRLTIHRIQVTLSCGCEVVCDFKDPLCKDPFKPVADNHVVAHNTTATVVEKAPTSVATKEYVICGKHKEDSSRSMLEFMMGERMDEVIEDAQRLVLRSSSFVQQEGLEGESVSKVGIIPGGSDRPKRPPTTVKTIQRSPEQLSRVGAVVERPAESVVEEGIELGVPNSTKSLDELLNDNDPTENKVAVSVRNP